MWNDTADDRNFIQEIARKIVDENAPEELELFDELVQEYFQNPSPQETKPMPQDDPLGFGLGESLVAVSPAAAAMVTSVLNFLMSEVLKVAQNESAELVKTKVKMLFKSEKPTPAFGNQKGKEIVPLTKEQLELVKKLAVKQALAYKIPPDKAQQMANSLIGVLALA